MNLVKNMYLVKNRYLIFLVLYLSSAFIQMQPIEDLDICTDKLTNGNSKNGKCKNNYFNITFPDPEDCKSFFYCQDYSLYPATCPSGSTYDYILKKCINASSRCYPPCDNTDYKIYIVYPTATTTKIISSSMSRTTERLTSPLKSPSIKSTKPLLTLPVTLSSLSTVKTTPHFITTSSTAVITKFTTKLYQTTPNEIITERLTTISLINTILTTKFVTYFVYTTSTVPLDPMQTIITDFENSKSTSLSMSSIESSSVTANSAEILTGILITSSTVSDTMQSKPILASTNDIKSVSNAIFTSTNILSSTYVDITTNIEMTTNNSTKSSTSNEFEETTSSHFNSITSTTLLASDTESETSSVTTVSNLDTTVTEIFLNVTSIELTERPFSLVTSLPNVSSGVFFTSDTFVSNASTSFNIETSTKMATGACHVADYCLLGEMMGDPDDCSRYYCCQQQGLTNRWLLQHCEDGFRFDSRNLSCLPTRANITCLERCSGQFEHTIVIDPEQPIVGKKLIFIAKVRIRVSFNYLTIEDFTWRLNGVGIYPIKNKISVTNTGPSADGYWTSRLTIEKATEDFSGNVESIVTYGIIYMHSISKKFAIASPPLIDILPLYASGKTGANFLIECNISQKGTLQFESVFKWFLNDTEIIITDTRYEIISNNQGSQIKLTANKNIRVSCLAINSFGQSNIATSYITILNSNEKLICNEIQSKNVIWPSSNAGQLLSLPCQNTTGMMYRLCDFDKMIDHAQWGIVDTSNCTSRQMAEFIKKFAKLRSGIGFRDPQILNETFDYLLEALSDPTSNLNEFDLTLKYSLMLLSFIDEMNIDNDYLIQNVFDLTNMLFADTFMENWKNYSKSASDLMVLIENITMDMARSLKPGEHKYFNSANFVIELLSESVTNESSSLLLPLSNSYGDNVIVPSTTLINAVDKEIIFVSFILFTKLHLYFPKNNSFLNSHILSLAIEGIKSKTNLNPNIILNLKQINYVSNMTPTCAYWNIEKQLWQNDGCRKSFSNSTFIECECEHLTNFAILMSLSEASETDAYILSIISTIGCVISIAALLLTIIINFYRWKHIRSHQTVIIMNLCLALIFAYVIFLAGADKTYNQTACTAVAILLHYFFLVVFFLMLVEGIELLICVIFVFHIKRTRETVVLLLVAWILPMVIVSLTLAITKLQGYGGEKSCWLQLENGVIWAFVGPALFIVAVNLIISVVILVRICGVKRPPEKDNVRFKIRATLWNILIIMPVVGLTWVFGVLSVNNKLIAFQYVFTILNSLQGLLIFIFHGLCNKQSKRKSTSTYGSSSRISKHKEPQYRRPSSDDSKYMIHEVPSNSSYDDTFSLNNGCINPGYMGSTSGYSASTGSTVLPNIEEEDDIDDIDDEKEGKSKVGQKLSSSTINSERSGVSGQYHFNIADVSY